MQTHGKASKFLIRNVAFDIHALIEQMKSTCQGQVAKPGRKVELGSKALVNQSGVEIVLRWM